MLPYGLQTAFGYDIMRSKVKSNISYDSDEWSLSNNMETVVKLKDEQWAKLTLEQKLNVLGTIKNVEMSYLGIPHEVYLTAGKTDSVNLLGYYNNREHRIVLNIDWLVSKETTGKDALKTLLHEGYHVYERACVEAYNNALPEHRNLLMFYNSSKFDENFRNYVQYEDDAFGYTFQAVEMAAEKYSDSAVEEYFTYIDEYMQKQSNENVQNQ